MKDKPLKRGIWEGEERMRKSLTWQLGVIIVCVIFISLMITSLTNYWSSYNKTSEAAGIEAMGCANITTGLISPDDIEALKRGNKESLQEVEEALNWTTDHKQIFENQYILLLDGTILAADDHLKKQGFEAGDQFYIDKEAIEIIKETRHPHYSDIYEYGGMKRLTGYAPIFADHDPNKEIIAVNAIDFNAKIVGERTWESVRGSLFLGIIPMAAACVVTIWVIRRKTKPISDLIQYSREIADGNLTGADISVKNKDEIGDLAQTLNVMKNNIREVINQVHISAEQVAASAEELTASAEQSSYAAEQITETMHQMASSVEKQVQSIEETYHTVNEMSVGVQHIADNSQNASSAAVETSEKAAEGERILKTASEQMKSIYETVEGLSQMIIGLGERSKEIGQITGVITGIADQTNLLALNAAIEAARAGENGRGFAVVADEVRKLAEQSARSAQEISELLEAVQEETTKAIESMKYASNAVIEGMSVVDTAGHSFMGIQHSIKDVTAQIQEVSDATKQMAEGAAQIVEAMQFITGAADKASAGAQKVSSSSEEQLASAQEISASANYLAQMAEELQQLINKFKT